MKPFRSRYPERTDLLGLGPQLGFAAATFAGFAAWSGLIVTVPGELVAPLIATLFLTLAAGFGIVAWRNRGEDPERVTYADVAGALTLIGLFTAATIDQDQLVRIVTAANTEN
jgi:hypothetical protein